MTGFQNIQRVTVEFVNRDGIPTSLIVDDVPADKSYAEIVVNEEGTQADFEVRIDGITNGTGWRFKDRDDEEDDWPRSVARVGAHATKDADLGPVGKIILSAVGLAILVPFIGILWAWASGVVRGMGGLW